MSAVRPAPGLPGYWVSDDGRLFRERASTRSANGYLHFSAFVGSERRTFSIHRLVCEAFHGPPRDGQVVRHLDGSRDNNRADNLTWGTPTENQADRVRHGTSARGSANHLAKLTEVAVLEIRRRLQAGETRTALARELGVSLSAVSQVALGKTWGHVR